MIRFAALFITLAVASFVVADEPKSAKPAVGHMVYFKLKESTPAAKEKLVAACKKYLENHDGVLYFAAGVRGEGFNREVNDLDWDVGLHILFADKAAHDKYADHPEHLKFIAENKETWMKVRVFDTEFTPTKKAK